MRGEIEDGRRRVGGTSDGARSAEGREASPRNSLQRGRVLSALVVAAGAFCYAMSVAATDASFAAAAGFSGSGLLVGFGIGAALVEGPGR